MNNLFRAFLGVVLLCTGVSLIGFGEDINNALAFWSGIGLCAAGGWQIGGVAAKADRL